MQFFDRYYREVFELDEGDIHSRLQACATAAILAFVTLFDENLVEAGRRLIDDPSDLGAKVDFVTAYHMVIEGVLALTEPALHAQVLRGPRPHSRPSRSFSNIARDEHRHVAYGTGSCSRRRLKTNR